MLKTRKMIYLNLINKLIDNKKGHLFLVLIFGFIVFSSYIFFPTFLGYDSYYFLDGVCGEGTNYNQATLSTVPPLSKLVFDALPCDVFLIKLLFVGLFTISLLIIYYINRLEHGKEAWRAIPFVLMFPVFLLSSLKIENDALAYPIIFLSFYFFLKYLKSEQTFVTMKLPREKKYLILSIILIGIAGLFWGGSFYYLLYYSILQPWLLILTIPFFIYFFGELTQPLIPNFNIISIEKTVDENNSIRSVRQLAPFIATYLLSNNLYSAPKRIWLMALPFLIIGIFSPKFLILLTPFVPLILIHAWKNASELTRPFMMPLAVGISLLFILQVGMSWYGPYDYEHDLTIEAISLANDNNMVLENDWGLGHLVFYHGGVTTNHSGLSNITCFDCIILTYEEFPDCELVREERELKILNCR